MRVKPIRKPTYCARCRQPAGYCDCVVEDRMSLMWRIQFRRSVVGGFGVLNLLAWAALAGYCGIILVVGWQPVALLYLIYFVVAVMVTLTLYFVAAAVAEI